MNKATLFLYKHKFIEVGFLGCMIDRFLFNFVRHCSVLFPILHPHQQRMRAPVDPHPRQHLVLSLFVSLFIFSPQ